MRLIDADELMLKVDMHGTNQFGMLDEDIRQFINDVPTVDAQPVKHARWIKTPSPYHVKCSSCKTMMCIKFHGVKVEKFCRNCGAKMDGGAENA